MALKIQNASWIPGAIEYVYLYEQQVTAVRDGVEIWTYKSEPGATLLEQVRGAKTRREVVRTLRKDESLRATVTVAESRSVFTPSGIPEGPKTYWISWEAPTHVFGSVLAEDVKVISVARDTEFVHKHFPWLTETDWIPEEH